MLRRLSASAGALYKEKLCMKSTRAESFPRSLVRSLAQFIYSLAMHSKLLCALLSLDEQRTIEQSLGLEI